MDWNGRKQRSIRTTEIAIYVGYTEKLNKEILKKNIKRLTVI